MCGRGYLQLCVCAVYDWLPALAIHTHTHTLVLDVGSQVALELVQPSAGTNDSLVVQLVSVVVFVVVVVLAVAAVISVAAVVVVAATVVAAHVSLLECIELSLATLGSCRRIEILLSFHEKVLHATQTQRQRQLQIQFTRPVCYCCCPCSLLLLLLVASGAGNFYPTKSDKFNFHINNKFGKTTSANRKESENAITVHIYMSIYVCVYIYIYISI